jgi:hypothetical protein
MASHELSIRRSVSSAGAVDELLIVEWPACHRPVYAAGACGVPIAHAAILAGNRDASGGVWTASRSFEHEEPSMSSVRGRLILIAAAIAVLSPAPAAHAKGIAQATICGADGCADITSRAKAPRDCPDCSAEQLLSDMPGSARPSRRAPFVRIVLGFGHPDQEGIAGRERMLYSSELRLAARQEGPDEWAWFRLSPAALAVAVRLARDITPYPAASMPLGRPAMTGTLVPAPAAAPTASVSDGTSLLPWLAGGAILAFGLGLVVIRARRGTSRLPAAPRRRPSQP